EDGLGGVVDDGDERQPLLRDQREPAVAAAVQVEQLAEAGARLAPPAMAAARPMRGDQARALQGFLDEGVAEGHAVLGPGPPQEVADVETVKAFAIEPEQPFDLRHGRPLGGWRLPAPVEQPLIAIPL